MASWIDFSSRKDLLVGALAVLFTLVGSSLHAGRVAYSFRDGGEGGVAIISVDEATGKITGHEVVFTDTRFALAKKLRFSKSWERFVLTNESEEPPFAVMSRSFPPAPAKVVDLPTVPDEVRAWGNDFLASCDKGLVVRFEAATGKVIGTWKGRKKLDPPGNRPEDIFLLPGLDLALVSFQKDNKKGTRFGNRLALLSLPDMTLVADLPLPRNHPELHLPGNLKEQGPGPEVVLASEQANTILVTLDLYGAVALLDLAEARRGQLASLVYLPVSLDGSWGTAFPDRATLLPPQTGTLALIVNAGEPGGASLVDLTTRKLLRHWDVPTGLEAPTWVEGRGLAVSVRSGKTKKRVGDTLVKEFYPGQELYVFDLFQEEEKDSLKVFDLGIQTSLVTAIPGREKHLVLVLGRGATGAEMLVVNPLDGSILDRQPAYGQPQRTETH
jgi:hypothetical protein